MEDYSFIIDQMMWSFSRLNSFYNCKKEWKLHYIDCYKSRDSAFSQFGTLVHKGLEKFEKGEISLFEIVDWYNDNFDKYVTERFPFNQYKDLRQSYYEVGLNYFENIDLMLDKNQVLGIEKRVEFEIDGVPFVGYIDLLLEDKKTGEITILDHKSASLKFLKSGKISKSDEAHFLEFKRQLYLYSIAVRKEFGKVDYLQWNMFRDGRQVVIPWNKREYNEAIKWARDTLAAIKNETEWEEKYDRFYCDNMCGMRDHCNLAYHREENEQGGDVNGGW